MLRIWNKMVWRTKRSESTTFIFKSALTSGGIFTAAIIHQQQQQQNEKDSKITSSKHFALAGAALRFLRSIKIGMTISIDYWVSTLFMDENSADYEQRMSTLHTRNANRMLNGCLVNGGTYIKIGQGLVSLSHILPKEYVATLSLLQDKCLAREDDEVYQIFIEEFGKNPAEVFKTFEPEPIAAASLAQVFLATTKNDERVAVKVQYADLQERFAGDVSTINFLLKLGGFLHPTFDFAWILEDLTENLRSELDFQNEGNNAERCANDLKHLTFVYVPKVYWNLCTKRVLVTEYVDGVKINEKDTLLKDGHKLADIDRKMFAAFGEQIFQVGFVHADPHPGNVFVRKVNNESQLVLLDHGLYQSLSENERVALSQFWQALVLRDHKKMDKYSKELGVQDYSQFAEVLTQTPLTREFKLVTRMTQAELDYFNEVAKTRLDIITKTLKDMPRSLLFVIRNLNTLRSIAHDHGDPVNRYTILARVATRTAFKSSDSFLTKILGVPTRIYFEYQLAMQRFWLWFMGSYLKFLNVIGRSPDASLLLQSMR